MTDWKKRIQNEIQITARKVQEKNQESKRVSTLKTSQNNRKVEEEIQESKRVSTIKTNPNKPRI